MATVRLSSSDNQVFEVDQEVARESQTIKNLLEDSPGTDDLIPLPNVNGKILSKIIEFCKFHYDANKTGPDGKKTKSEDEIKSFDANFVQVPQPELFDLILAANYLNIKALLDLTCQTVAQMIKGKTPEEIRKHFNIKNDFTPEEEEEVRRENQWAFD